MAQTAVLTGTQWHIDPVHSEIAFRIRHLMITNVRGTFTDYTASIQADPHHPMTSEVSVTINPASIDTGEAGRDQHLRSADFFEAEKFKTIEFRGTSYEKTSEPGFYKLHGDLTMKGVTRPVTLDVEFGGTTRDPWGNEKAGLTVTGKINRKDWGLEYNAALETGGVLLGEEVKIQAEIQLVKK